MVNIALIACTSLFQLIDLYWKIPYLLQFNTFVPNASFLYPLEISENLTVFWCFQGAEKRCIGSELVKRTFPALKHKNQLILYSANHIIHNFASKKHKSNAWYLFKVHNKDTRKMSFIVNFEHISYLFWRFHYWLLTSKQLSSTCMLHLKHLKYSAT